MNENEWKKYRRTGLSEMRPYVPGEDLTNISVAEVDTPEVGGMVARNPKNHEDQWYVSKVYFADNLEPAISEEEEVTITKKEHDQLQKDQHFLCMLEGHGVDNWFGFDEAQSEFREKYPT